MKYIILSFALLAAGCASQSPMDLAKSDCLDYGYTPGSADYMTCLQNVHPNYVRMADERQRAASVMMYNTGQSLQAPAPAPYEPMEPLTKHTQCYESGAGSVNCISR